MEYTKRYELVLKENHKGVYLTEKELLKIIKICNDRHSILYKKLVEDWEYMNNRTFSKDMIKDINQKSEKISK